jgi:hypothetical protein
MFKLKFLGGILPIFKSLWLTAIDDETGSPVAVKEPEAQKKEPEVPISDDSNGDKKEDLISYSKYRELLDEKKKTQKRLEEVVQKQEEAERLKLEEQGKFKELYDSLKTEHDNLAKFKNEIETDLQAELDKELDNADDLHKQLIRDSGMSLQKKISYLRQLKGEKKPVNNSPNNERAGGEAMLSNIDIKDYQGKEGRVKLMQLRKTDPKLWEKIIEIKNKF